MTQGRKATKIVAIAVAVLLLIAAAVGLSVYATKQNVMSSNAAEVGASVGDEESNYKLTVTQPAGVTIALTQSADSVPQYSDTASLEGILNVSNKSLAKKRMTGTGVQKIYKASETSYDLYLDETTATEECYIVFCYTVKAPVQSVIFSLQGDGTLDQHSDTLDITWESWPQESGLTLNAEVEGVDHTVSFNAGTGYTVSTVTDAEGNGASVLTKTSWTVKDSQTTYFKVESKDPAKSVTVMDGMVSLDANEHGVYTLEKVTEDVSLTILLEDKTVEISYEYSGQESNVNKIEMLTTAPYGKAFTFKVSPKSGYELKVTAKKGDSKEIEVHQEGNEYTIAAGDVTDEKITVTITVSEKSYTVNYSYDSSAVTFELQPSTATYNETFTLKVKLNKGYKWNSISATTSSSSLTISGDAPTAGGDASTYTIAAQTITDDITVTISTSNGIYTVETQSGVGYTISGASTRATHGTNYTFAVTPDAGYTLTSVEAKIGDGANIAAPNGGNGAYIILGENITGDIKITASAEKITYTITLSPGDGFTYTTEDGVTTTKLSVKHGDSVSFKLKADDGYNLGNAKVHFAGDTVSLEDGKYTLKNVSQAGTVTVTGVKQANYNITLNDAEGFKISSTSSNTNLTWGQRYAFSVAVGAGYDPTKYTVSLKSGGSDLASSVQEKESYYIKDGNDTYTVTVRSDIDIQVAVNDNTGHDGKLTYTVKDVAETAKGYKLQIVGDTHYYGDNVNFTVTAEDGYQVTSVLVNGTNAEIAGDGYVITSISKDCNITVNVKEYVLHITWKDEANNLNETENVNYTDIAAKENRVLTATYYTGTWTFGEEGVTEVKQLQDKVKKSDFSITVTATWALADEATFKDFASYKTEFVKGKDNIDGNHGTTVSFLVKLATNEQAENHDAWAKLLAENKAHGAGMVLGFVVASTGASSGYGSVQAAQEAWSGDVEQQFTAQLGSQEIFAKNSLTYVGGTVDGLQLVEKKFYAYGVTCSEANCFTYRFNSNGKAMQNRAIGFYLAISYDGVTHLIQSEMKEAKTAIGGAELAKVMEAILPEAASSVESYEEPTID